MKSNRWDPGKRQGASANPASLQAGMERMTSGRESGHQPDPRGSAITSAAALDTANRLFQQGDLPAAQQAYDRLYKAAADAGTRSGAAYGLGLIMLQQADDEGARGALTAAVQIDPANSNAFYYLGVLSRRQGDHEGARRWFQHSLEVNPQHAGARSALGLPATSAPAGQASSPAAPPAAAPPQVGTAPTNTPPRRPSSPSSIVGIAAHVRQQVVPWRGKPASIVQMSFRVNVPASESGAAQSYAFEMRGHEINGSIDDGDWVEIPPHQNLDKPLKLIVDLTTGQTVKSKFRIFGAP